ncbi:MAG: 4Fe-4S binding protein [Anaerolineaceae bacterium]|nr:4Fe-4S binding protein [Anaerolineaceae bacterium]
MKRFDLVRYPWLRSLLINPWPQLLLRVITLSGLIFTILTGFLGTVVGSHNFTIIIVWIAWWTLLKLFFIPFGGRSWCSICPIPMPGDWLQQGGIIEKTGNRGIGLGKKWPGWLRGNWIQAGGFLIIGLFSAVTLTSTRVTAWVLLGVLFLALISSLVFERRAFCNHLCPIGGFTGLYAQAAPIELRIVDKEICRKHPEKTCYHNCPWGVYPVALKTNTNCGLCMECLRVCPHDNIAVNLRPFGSDFDPGIKYRLDEVFLGLVMLGSVLVNSAIFLGPWGELKSAAYEIGSLPWLVYGAGMFFVTLVVLPGLYFLGIWASQKLSGDPIALRAAVVRDSQFLFPLGLMAWVAFTISFALAKYFFIFQVISDPFGWGWNLFNLAQVDLNLDTSTFSSVMQGIVLLVGLYWATRVVSRSYKTSLTKALPLIGFCFIFTLTMSWLLLG